MESTGKRMVGSRTVNIGFWFAQKNGNKNYIALLPCERSHGDHKMAISDYCVAAILVLASRTFKPVSSTDEHLPMELEKSRVV